MNRIFLLTTLLSVCALSYSSLVGHRGYGVQQGGHSLGYGGNNRYAPAPQSHRPPQHQAYGAPRGLNYRQHQPAPAPYAGGRHLNLPSPGLNHYGAPAHFAAAGPYGGSHGVPAPHAPLPGHYSSPKRSVYQPQQPQQPAYTGHSPRYGPAQPRTYSQSHNSAQSSSQTHGREMKYTIRDPQNKGTTHVSETHVVSNRQMHGAEAEAAMKKLMGSMGPGTDNGFQDLVKGMGLPFY